MGKEIIKEVKQVEYGGKKSLSITLEKEENGKNVNGLLTADRLASMPEGFNPEVGSVHEVVIEKVKKRDGSGTWTSISFPELEKKSDKPSTGRFPQKTYGAQEDAYSKIVNTALMSAASIATASPVGDTDVIKLFNSLVDAAVTKYESVKK